VQCPLCKKEASGKTVVYTVTVATAQGEYIRRRRKCPRCGGRWWSYEISERDWRMLEAFRAQLEAATITPAVQAPEPEPARPKYRF
jgi:transcriptional regulator NrdR family protein